MSFSHPRRRGDIDNVGELRDEVLQVGDLLLEVAPRRQRLLARVQVGEGGGGEVALGGGVGALGGCCRCRGGGGGAAAGEHGRRGQGGQCRVLHEKKD